MTSMQRGRTFGWLVVCVALALASWLFSAGAEVPQTSTLVFWILLLLGAELLPVSLGFETRVTMAFPVHLATEILFAPPVAMLIVGIGAFDIRELRRELPLWRAVFNRAQIMLAAGAASAVAHLGGADPFQFPEGAVLITLTAATHIFVNLGLVALMVNQDRGVPLLRALRSLLPDPVAGFFASQMLLAGLGAATAAAYEEIQAFVVAFLIPLLFARLSFLGARAQQELAERVRKQQQALLDATERVFQERENERKRIAEEIHDSSLQMLAAAAYSCGNAEEFIDANRFDLAQEAVNSARSALDDAIQTLRGSLVDLRRSSVEQGGLMDTINQFVDHAQTLWGTEVRIEGTIDKEPPLPVALAAFQILQEGLTNALKHAQSSTVTVRIENADSLVNIVVEDNGTGFDPDSEVGTEHVGMRLMMERAARVGGRVELDTKPGAGTRLKVVLPGGVAQ